MTQNLTDSLKGKDTVFVSTKNIDYIRNTQEIELISKYSNSIKIIAFSTKNYLLRVLKVYFHLIPVLFKKKYDVLFLGFSPQLLFLLFPFFPKNKLIIIDFFISVYDTLVDDRKKFKNGGILSNLTHWLDTKTIHKADLVITDTLTHGNYFSKEFQFPIDKIETIYISADTSIYQNNRTIAETKHSQYFEVIYFGSILPVQGIEIILHAMKKLKDDPSIKFTIVGPIIKKYQLDSNDFPNTTFIEWLTQEQLALQIANSNLALAGHFSATIGKANRTIAGKTYIYKAMNKPVILGDSEANRELFKEDNKNNFYVERGNPTALAEKIKKISKNELE